MSSLISFGEKKQIGSIDKEANLIPIPKFETEEIDPESQTLKEFLDSILPPKKIEENGLLFYQFVSNDSAIVNDVIKLSNELDNQLKISKAKEKGICPIREQLFNECFDEIIRQVSIGCIQRGALLHRIKTEANYSINYYQKLYESLISFSLRKVLQEKKKIKKLEDKKERLEKEIEQLNKSITQISEDHEKKMQDEKIEEENAVKEHQETVQKTRDIIKQRVADAESILTKPSEDYNLMS